MIVRYYGLYDAIAKEYVRTFTAANDECAERAGKYIVRDKTFDPIAGKDYVIQYVYSFDTNTGKILDNSVKMIVPLAQAVAEFELEKIAATNFNLTKEDKKQDDNRTLHCDSKKGDR